MPKGMLQYDLPEEQQEWELTCGAGDMYTALYELYYHLRQQWKHGDDEQKAVWAEEAWAVVCDNLESVSIP